MSASYVLFTGCLLWRHSVYSLRGQQACIPRKGGTYTSPHHLVVTAGVPPVHCVFSNTGAPSPLQAAHATGKSTGCLSLSLAVGLPQGLAVG